MIRAVTVLLLAAAAQAADPNPAVRIDQVGYLPDAPKLAMVVANPAASTFTVRRLADDMAVFSAALGAQAYDSNSGDSIQIADFTALEMPGRYYIDVPGAGRSYPFEISPNVYRRAYYLSMRAFYGQRCGTAVDMGPEFPHHHAACHTAGAWHWTSGRSGPRESSRGWHDAGDYGRYIVNSGISTGTLLWAWELYGARMGAIALDIPESGNAVPDMLDEIRWNLDWMLTLQDEADGGVWHKQTKENFAPFIMPEADTPVNYVIGTGFGPWKDSCATGDFAAVMSAASRVYARIDPAFAARAGNAAASAWNWLESNRNVAYRQNPSGVLTGAYEDANCSDENLWAAAELWRSTGEDRYRVYFLQNYGAFVNSVSAPGWQSVAPMALWTYALANRQDDDATALQRIRDATVKAANQLVDRAGSNGYRITMGSGDFYWGSNSVALNCSLLLMIADRLAPDARYRDAALENLHYILGRNTFSVSWVTAVGSDWFKRPHHRPSGADGIDEPWPGMLAGGPNSHRDNDPVLRASPEGLPPMRYWFDDQGSWATNEICINWNAPLVFVLAGNLPQRIRMYRPTPPGRRKDAGSFVPRPAAPAAPLPRSGPPR